MVARITQKLIDEVPVGAVQLDPVEPGLPRPRRGTSEVADDSRDIRQVECAGRPVRDRPIGGVHDAGRRDRQWRNGETAVGLKRGDREPPDMPELSHDQPPGVVHRAGNPPPPLDVGSRVHTRCIGIADPLLGDLRSLRG